MANLDLKRLWKVWWLWSWTGTGYIWELTDSPGISLQSLRSVLFPTQGMLPWAPHTRFLICKPESSQADHSDQAIQPPKHRKKNNQYKPRQPQGHIKLRRPGNQRAHPSCHHPRPLTFLASQAAQIHQKSVCDVNRIGRVSLWRVCLVHSRDVCLLCWALVLFPRSRRPSSEQRLLPKRWKKIPNSPLLPLNHAVSTPFHPVFKSTEVEGARTTAMKGWWKSWFVIQGALKCAVLAETAWVKAEDRPLFTFPISLVLTDRLLSLHHLLPSCSTTN